MKELRDQLFFWPTWATRLIAGEDHCFFKSWFKSHYRNYDKMPNDFNMAGYAIKHTAMIRERTDALERLGYRVLIEDQNSFKFSYNGATISGKPDIVAFGRDETVAGEMVEEAVIEDAKSGKAKISDQIQIYIYQIFLPLAVPEYAAVKFKGEVLYKPGIQNVEIPETIIDDQSLRDEVFKTIDKIIGPEINARCVPSRSECRFCDITAADCAKRIKL